MKETKKTLPEAFQTGVERHPLEPFLPTQPALLLMLGSFPPARKRWSMDFFYPNFQNDMWRIFGLCFHHDKLHFVDEEHKTFRLEAIRQLLNTRGIALYDTATVVRRLKNTASDKDLEVVEPTRLDELIGQMPALRAVATTGERATGLFCHHFHIEKPPQTGTFTTFNTLDGNRQLRLYRMPSSSRAYPMAVERKAQTYLAMFEKELTR